MSHLIPDFVLNPVLRQARRFSRPDTTGDLDLQTSHQSYPDSGDETSTSGINEQGEPTNGLGSWRGEFTGAGDENEGSERPQEDELRRLPSVPAAFGRPQMTSIGMSSGSENIDAGTSDNPSFGLGGALRGMSPAEGPSPPPTQVLSQPEPISHHGDSLLPDDDGMSALRQQIFLVQAMEVSAEQKARMMHGLLTRGYYQAQENFHTKSQPRTASPESMISQEGPTTPASLSSFLWHMNGVVDDPSPDQQYTFHLSPDDLKRTYVPFDPLEIDEDGAIRSKEDMQVLGCQHYRRNVKLQCSTCEKWYTCRLCHDEVEDHVLIRKATKNMLCMICGRAQRAGEFCVECTERTAWYYCGVCKLWDNDPNKSIYHCNDCGICRKGRGLGKDFFHCKTCGVCMSMSVEHSHKCIERVSDCDCPICGEYMFTSPRPVVFMLCGHSIHQTCYYEHMKSSYKCPICSKSTINMETQFRNLDRAIDNQPMPPQFQDTEAMVSCNDCYAKSAVKYHWLGLKCAICDSYNTAQLSILSDPSVAVPDIESREAGSRTVLDQGTGESTSPALVVPGPTRYRRHSAHALPPTEMSETSVGFPPYSVPQRTARSVSPMHRRGLFDSFVAILGGETDDSRYEDDELDFWGRDEQRSATTLDNIEDDMDDSDSDGDSVSATDDCDEGEDEDLFQLLGHR